MEGNEAAQRQLDESLRRALRVPNVSQTNQSVSQSINHCAPHPCAATPCPTN